VTHHDDAPPVYAEDARAVVRMSHAIAEIKRRIFAAEDQAGHEPDDYPGSIYKHFALAEAEALRGALKLLEPISPEELARVTQYAKGRGWIPPAAESGGDQ
jgi:hypothetical protein